MSYSPTLMRWAQQDPAGYVDGLNLFEAEVDNPISNLDPTGLTRTPQSDPTDLPTFQSMSPEDRFDFNVAYSIFLLGHDNFSEREAAQNHLMSLLDADDARQQVIISRLDRARRGALERGARATTIYEAFTRPRIQSVTYWDALEPKGELKEICNQDVFTIKVRLSYATRLKIKQGEKYTLAARSLGAISITSAPKQDVDANGEATWDANAPWAGDASIEVTLTPDGNARLLDVKDVKLKVKTR